MVKEIIKYFVNELGCEIEGDRNYMKKSPHNASIAKFSAEIMNSKLVKVTCKTINNIDHLIAVEKNGAQSMVSNSAQLSF